MMQYWLKRYNDLKLSGKMMLLYTISMMVFCCVALVALRASFNVYDGNLYEKSLQELDFFVQRVDDTLDDVNQLTQRLALNLDVQDELSAIALLDYPSNAYSYRIYQLHTLIQNEMAVYPAVKNISFIDKGRIQMTLGEYCGEIDNAVYRQLLADFSAAQGGYVYVSPSSDYPYLLSGRNILKTAEISAAYLGAYLVTTDIAGVIDNYSESLEAEHSALFVYSEDHLIYSEADTALTVPVHAVSGNTGYDVIDQQGERYFICYLKSARTGWTYVNMFPYSEVYQKTEMVRHMVVGAFALIFCILLFVMQSISVTITKPLRRLTESMFLVEEGNFQKAKEMVQLGARRDEVGQLALEYQTMLDKIDELMYENYEKQLLLKETKYQMLQAQINPHFLNNTLNTINWMVKANRNEDAAKMIVCLGQLMRATFEKEALTTVAEEVQIAQNYIVIQQYRYQKRAEFIVETSGDLSNYQMPVMVLQPLIENALLHGVDCSPDPCCVQVRAVERENDILLEVSDTGAGMTQEELLTARTLNIQPKGHGIGLKNICERLHMIFRTYTFMIDSKIGQGTVIRILIPKRRGISDV